MYRLAREHNPARHLAFMHAGAASLRAARVRARALLLAAALDSGEVAVRGGGLGGGAAQAVRWWASGPRGADMVVLLAGEDGESAALWGRVHAALAEALPAARVVSYHRAPLRGGGGGTALSLRVRDAELALGAAAAAAAGGRGAAAARVVHVAAGEGAWGALALAGLHPRRTAGVVLVAPVLQHRGKEEAWMDAVPAASRVPHAEGLLAGLLAPPRVLAATGGGRGDDALRGALDARWVHRKELAAAVAAGEPGAPPPPAPVSVPAAERRFDEDFRRRRAGTPALPAEDLSLLQALCGRLPGAVVVCAVAVGPGCAPPWLDAASARAHEVKQAAVAAAAGSLLAPEGSPAAARLAALRAEGAALAREDALGPLTAALHALGSPPGAVEDAVAAAGGGGRPRKRFREGLDGARAYLASLPLAMGFFAQGPLPVAPVMRNVEAQVREAPPNFFLTLLRGGGEEGECGLLSVPLQRPEAVVREVMRIVGGGGVTGGGGERALEYV